MFSSYQKHMKIPAEDPCIEDKYTPMQRNNL